jgi:hypothetical protein
MGGPSLGALFSVSLKQLLGRFRLRRRTFPGDPSDLGRFCTVAKAEGT